MASKNAQNSGPEPWILPMKNMLANSANVQQAKSPKKIMVECHARRNREYT